MTADVRATDRAGYLQQHLELVDQEIEQASKRISELEAHLKDQQAFLHQLRQERVGVDLAYRRLSGDLAAEGGEDTLDLRGAPGTIHMTGRTLDEGEVVSTPDRADDGQDTSTPFVEGIPRTDAIVKVLAYNPGGMSPADVRDALQDLGRDDAYEVVSSALAYLKKKGRVTQPRKGMYAVPPASEEPTSKT